MTLSKIQEMEINKERKLKELFNLDIGYQALCIQLLSMPKGSTNYELKSGLIYFLHWPVKTLIKT